MTAPIDTKAMRNHSPPRGYSQRDDLLLDCCDEIDALRQRVFDLEKSEGQLRGKIHDLEYKLMQARGQGRMR